MNGNMTWAGKERQWMSLVPDHQPTGLIVVLDPVNAGYLPYVCPPLSNVSSINNCTLIASCPMIPTFAFFVYYLCLILSHYLTPIHRFSFYLSYCISSYYISPNTSDRSLRPQEQL